MPFQAGLVAEDARLQHDARRVQTERNIRKATAVAKPLGSLRFRGLTL